MTRLLLLFIGAGLTVVFTVARAEPDLPAQALEFGGETYGCATI